MEFLIKCAGLIALLVGTISAVLILKKIRKNEVKKIK